MALSRFDLKRQCDIFHITLSRFAIKTPQGVFLVVNFLTKFPAGLGRYFFSGLEPLEASAFV
jgi:hypothetical protein